MGHYPLLAPNPLYENHAKIPNSLLFDSKHERNLFQRGSLIPRKSGSMRAKRTKKPKTSSNARINGLPDDILSSIISLLPFRECVRTSIISCRWKYLWKSYADFSPSINLDRMTMRANNFFNVEFSDLEDILKDNPENDGRRISLWGEERRNFVRWADQMMKVKYNSGCVRNSFDLCFYLSKDFSKDINGWINTAIAKGVHIINIDFSTHPGPFLKRHYEDLYTFASLASDTILPIKCLSLRSLELGLLDFKWLVNIVDLYLEDMKLDVGSFTKLLTNCPNIEKLSLVKTWGLCASTLHILGSALKLKHLRLDNSCTADVINMDTANLIKLEYVGDPLVFTFQNIPEKLSEVTIDFLHQQSLASLNKALSLLLKDIPNLESLFLAVSYCKRKDKMSISVIKAGFVKLKKLVLRIFCEGQCLWGYIHLVHASPYLNTFELHLFESALTSLSIPKRFVERCHEHLKEIILTGFKGTCHEIEFVKYLLTNCSVLKKMMISTRVSRYNHNQGGKEVVRKKMEIEMRCRRELKEVIPSRLQLQFD